MSDAEMNENTLRLYATLKCRLSVRPSANFTPVTRSRRNSRRGRRGSRSFSISQSRNNCTRFTLDLQQLSNLLITPSNLLPGPKWVSSPTIPTSSLLLRSPHLRSIGISQSINLSLHAVIAR